MGRANGHLSGWQSACSGWCLLLDLRSGSNKRNPRSCESSQPHLCQIPQGTPKLVHVQGSKGSSLLLPPGLLWHWCSAILSFPWSCTAATLLLKCWYISWISTGRNGTVHYALYLKPIFQKWLNQVGQQMAIVTLAILVVTIAMLMFFPIVY